MPTQLEAPSPQMDPLLICRVPSGWVLLCPTQFLRGYCILKSDPPVFSINDLDAEQRALFLQDMVLVGDSLLDVTGAYRMNYALMSNTNPVLHAHIVPRYLTEPEELRKGPPWFYPNQDQESLQFDAVRDRPLMDQIRESIQKRLK